VPTQTAQDGVQRKPMTPVPASGSNAWTSVIGAGLSAYLARRAKKLSDLSYWASASGPTQAAQLRGLLRTASKTAIGRDAGFAKIAAIDDDATMIAAYRDALPVADYERYRARLAQMREHAAPDLLWPGIVYDWAQTSGTTGGEKYIPVSKHMMRSNKTAAFDIFAHSRRAGVPLRRLFGGKMLFLGGCTETRVNQHGIRTGDLSGLVTPLINWPLSEVYEPGPDIALEPDWPTKIRKIVDRCGGLDIRFISGMASWSLLLLEDLLEDARASGRIKSDGTVRDIWPNLTTFVHGGVRYPPFDPRVRAAWSGNPDTNDPAADIPHRLEVYPASEGFIAVQDTPGDPGLRLHTDTGIFFEFIPAEQIDPDNADDWERGGFDCFDVTQVEKGQRYVVCMTTCAGLWRYVIGDVVVFDSVPPEGPARLRIVGRHRHFINAFGENLIVEEIENAAVAARDRSGLTIGEFTAAPVYPGESTPPGLELVVEFAEPGAAAGQFQDAFDHALKEQNVDYTTKRTSGFGMAPPRITPVPMGTFSGWMASRGKLGGQNKVPRCANHREFVDGLRAHVGMTDAGAAGFAGRAG
jgi:hypothetical protein